LLPSPFGFIGRREAFVPQILVVTDSTDQDGDVVYRERISRADLESEHFSGQLMERISWALGDATALEHDGWLPLLRPPLRSVATGRGGLRPRAAAQRR
jgi:hypothetical protein